jgi:hypothetical protein
MLYINKKRTIMPVATPPQANDYSILKKGTITRASFPKKQSTRAPITGEQLLKERVVFYLRSP